MKKDRKIPVFLGWRLIRSVVHCDEFECDRGTGVCESVCVSGLAWPEESRARGV